MLDNNNKIIAYTIDKKMIVRCERSKQLSYIKKENMQEKVLETMATMSGMCCYPF